MSLHANKPGDIVWQGSFNGISIYSNPEIDKSTIRIFDTNGKLVGVILDVGFIEVNVDGRS